MLESRQSRTTKNSTFMAVPTFKGRYQTNPAFKYTLYKRLQTIVRNNRNCFPQGKFNHFHIALPMAMPSVFFMPWLYRRYEIQAKPYNILRHFYITPISSKILSTKYPLRSTFNRKLWRYALQVRRQTQSCTITPRPWPAACLPFARSAGSRSCLIRTLISSLTTLWYIFKLLCDCWQILDVFGKEFA